MVIQKLSAWVLPFIGLLSLVLVESFVSSPQSRPSHRFYVALRSVPYPAPNSRLCRPKSCLIMLRAENGEEADASMEGEDRAASIDMNLLCNVVVKAILSGSDTAVNQAKENVAKAATTSSSDDCNFLEALTSLLDHTSYGGEFGRPAHRQAYDKILSLVEDAGWQIGESPFIVMG